MRRWWRVGLNQTQLADLERDARDMILSYGPKAREAILSKAADYGRRHHTEAAWLCRVAACTGEFQPTAAGFDVQLGVAPLQPNNFPQATTNVQGETKNLHKRLSS